MLRFAACREHLVGQFLFVAHKPGVLIGSAAVPVQHFSIAALLAAHKDHHLMRPRKLLQLLHAIRYASAYCIMCLQPDCRLLTADSLFYGRNQLLKSLYRLCRLREEIYWTREVDFADFIGRFYHQSCIVGLALQTDHLSMPALTVYHDLRWLRFVHPVLLIACPYAVLQFLYHRTGRVDDLYAALPSYPVCAGRFAMSTQQNTCMVQGSEIIIVDGPQSFLLQPRTLLPVVHDIPQAAQLTALQLLLCFANRTRYAKAEPAMWINLNDQLLL